MSVNTDLQTSTITHSHYLYRYQTYEINRVVSILNDAHTAINETLLKYGDTTNWTKTRQEKLLTEINGIQNEFQKEVNSLMNSDMKTLTSQEHNYQLKQLDSELSPYMNFKMSDRVIDPNTLYAMARNSYIMMADGTTLTPRQLITKVMGENNGKILQAIRQGTLTGQTGSQIKKNLVTNFNASRVNADALVRTITNHFSNQAKAITGKENQDVILGYEWVSTLDKRTTHLCADRDSKVWIYDPVVRENSSYSLLPGEVYPPAHYRCRSSITYITKSYRDLGLDMDEVPDGTRSSLNGYVPQRTTYYDWLETQSATTQRDVLGTTRYDMWQSGEYKPYQFYSRDGRWLTLDELAKKG